MSGSRTRGRLRLLVLLLAIVVAVLAGVSLVSQAPKPSPPRVVQSLFQDDKLLLYQPDTPAGTAEVQRTLLTLRSLGVDRLRLTIEWAYIAPTPVPRGFDPTDPGSYAPSAWAPYDRIDRLAAADGLGVDFDVTGPGPLWAMQPGAPNLTTAPLYEPSAAAFGQFVTAVGRRYDGHYRPSSGRLAGATAPLPRVSFWSIWNEPNQPGWLAPQWSPNGTAKSPALYRRLVDAAYAALGRTGHGRDTILIGELAPEGCVAGSPCIYSAAERPIPPIPFLQALYCVGPDYEPLRGAAATAAGCSATSSGFVRDNPGLFDATGFAHHPYSFLTAPNVSLPEASFVPLADLGRLETGLDRVFAAYGSSRRIPLYLDEYGYETSPPRTKPPLTTLSEQSLYLNEAEYMAWQDPRVRALSQFQLQDSAPDYAYPPGTIRYWSTFQTGLEFLGGAPKPSLDSYRLPIYLPDTQATPGQKLLVWGMLRLAPNRTRQTARLQWRAAKGAYRTIATVTTTDPSGFLTVHVAPPGSGAIRLSWTSTGGHTYFSRTVNVTVAG